LRRRVATSGCDVGLRRRVETSGRVTEPGRFRTPRGRGSAGVRGSGGIDARGGRRSRGVPDGVLGDVLGHGRSLSPLVLGVCRRADAHTVREETKRSVFRCVLGTTLGASSAGQISGRSLGTLLSTPAAESGSRGGTDTETEGELRCATRLWRTVRWDVSGPTVTSQDMCISPRAVPGCRTGTRTEGTGDRPRPVR
jgi:hypothetical protein